MRQFTSILLILCAVQVYGSPQRPDILIVDLDTIPIYSLPLEEYLMNNKDNYLVVTRNSGKGFYPSFNCWRGYVAYWRLTNNQLALDSINAYFEEDVSSDEIMRRIFPNRVNESQILAEWFSSTLVLPKGPMVKWDNIFGRTYKREELLHFKAGQCIKREMVNNYIDKNNGISRIHPSEPRDTIVGALNCLDWEKLAERFCDDEFEMKINRRGRVRSIRYVPYGDTKWEDFIYTLGNYGCKRKITRVLRRLRFDIIKWHGEPFEEEVLLILLYDEEKGILEYI